MSVWELCDSSLYSKTLQHELRTQLRAVTAGLISLVEHIPRDEAAVTGLEGKREDLLGATGQLWEVCERMKKLAGMGIVGVALEKADAYHALLKDAVEEIEGWDPDEEESSLFGSDASVPDKVADTETVGSRNGKVDGEEGESEVPPLDGLQIKDIHAVKSEVLKVLKLIRMLYPALKKRRITTFPQFDRASDVGSLPPERKTAVLDQVLEHLNVFSDEADEVTGALYDHDVKHVDRRLNGLRTLGYKCVDQVKLDWNGGEDEFSGWSATWVQKLRETGPAT
ncbi:MAG: hypothetical protein L6R39_006033 [Caloplaca ligustica]|nr:MAG: hypothetical protein L6R39_006033 [Caloplaca ligustica]